MIRSFFARCGMAAAVLLLAACGRGVTSTPGDAPNLEKWVEGERARPAQPLEPLPVMQQFETFEYSAQGLRDPFTDAWTNPQGMADCGRIRTGARSPWRASRWTHWTWSVPSAPAAAPSHW